MIKVVIADDHPAVREGIQRRLERHPEIQVVGEAHDGPSLFSTLGDKSPLDVLLLDIRMPEFSLLESLPKMRVRWPQMKILIITANDDSASIRDMINAGVDGYLIKDEDMSVYPRAIHRVSAGGTYFSQQTFSVVCETAEARMPSPRELQILTLVAQDATTDEIATRLSIAPSTVETHVRRACEKLGVNRRAAAVAKAIQLGYIKVFE